VWTPPEYLTGHSGAIYALDFKRDFAASGSTDRTIRLWSVKNRQCLQVFTHGSTVSEVCILDNALISSSWEKDRLKVWNLSTGELIRSFGEEHKNAVRHFRANRNMLVSGGDDSCIIIWLFAKK
jgi:WD40 repeat protein